MSRLPPHLRPGAPDEESVSSDHTIDWARLERTGIAEAVMASGKSRDQLEAILHTTVEAGARMLVTRLAEDAGTALAASHPETVAYHPPSGTAVFGIAAGHDEPVRDLVAIVAAGTSDMRVAREARQTLRFHGHEPLLVRDVGVAGLWRLMARIDEIREARVVIAVAGMEGALFSVLAGLVPAPLVAVPSSVGYGVGANGEAALRSALASCAPGIVAVNIDNGFGAAAAALKMLAIHR